MSSAAAAKLPTLTSSTWHVPCTSLAQKQELWDYAESKGVPLLAGPIDYEAHGELGYRDDMDKHLGWCDCTGTGYPSGLMSFLNDGTAPKRVSPDQFKAMCDAYAAH